MLTRRFYRSVGGFFLLSGTILAYLATLVTMAGLAWWALFLLAFTFYLLAMLFLTN